MGPKATNSSVLGRAWGGLVEFYKEFTGGPGFVTNNKVNFKAKGLKGKLKTRTKLAIKKSTRLEVPKPRLADVKREAKLEKKAQVRRPPEKFEQEPNWNSVIEEHEAEEKMGEVQAGERVKLIEKAQEPKLRKRTRHMLNEQQISRKRKHLLFMNPGTKKIMEAVQALKGGGPLPVWTTPFRAHLTVEGSTLYFDDQEMATEETKRDAVKRLYFDPKGASTIQPITDELYKSFANIRKGDVTRILRSLETYQRNFRRRLPAKVNGRMNLTKPGVIMMDTFYPSRKVDGWHGNYSILCCMDGWSRFSRCYVCERKTKEIVGLGMERFLAEFASKGHLPRMILADKGSELAHATKAIELYRRKPGNLVHNSVTGQPVLMVENMQSQYQRRMAVFRTASLTDDPAVILDDISEHLNSQKRPDRGNLTPVQLLTLNSAEIKKINDMYKDKAVPPEVKGLRELLPGHNVRILLMTRKEQLDTSQKGFRAKWSKKIYSVLKRTKLQLNPNNFRYYVGKHQSYYRHELLWVPKVTDTEVLDLVGTKSSLLAEAWSGEDESDYEDSD